MKLKKMAKKAALSEQELENVSGGCVAVTLEHIEELPSARLTTLEKRRGFGKWWRNRGRVTTLELKPEDKDKSSVTFL